MRLWTLVWQSADLIPKDGIDQSEELVAGDVVRAAAAGIPDRLVPPGGNGGGVHGSPPAQALPGCHSS